MAARKAKLVLAKVDEENGCEACWDAARADGVRDVPGEQLLVRAPVKWVGRACPHGAPDYAPSILLRGRGRPRLDPEGSVELRVRVTQEQARRLEEIAEREGLQGQAAAVRWAIDLCGP